MVWRPSLSVSPINVLLYLPAYFTQPSPSYNPVLHFNSIEYYQIHSLSVCVVASSGSQGEGVEQMSREDPETRKSTAKFTRSWRSSHSQRGQKGQSHLFLICNWFEKEMNNLSHTLKWNCFIQYNILVMSHMYVLIIANFLVLTANIKT